MASRIARASPIRSRSATMGSASTRNILIAFSRSSSACMGAGPMRGPVLDWQSAARLSSAIRERSAPVASRARVRHSSSRCPHINRWEELPMNPDRTPITILMADDDEDDRLLTQEALAESRLANDLHFVTDGEALMDYLNRRGEYAGAKPAPRPGVILLDLNMPRKDGREALREIKADPELRHIPIVVLTTSKDEEDIYRSYD